ncbi:hypothetical protein EZV62_004639 [Acer yangbiense]|uniref:Wax synthase domain-containing protein n=1 Tax=Acer yangbiense TaxID=1000413 RepID=A0A5C7ILH0_9ROSI|nr:hypothetical protein EZV62_004639 [Acer yangbiense]
MEGEMRNLIIVWLSAFASLSYCYIIDKITPKALSIRLFAILPTICLLLILPLNLHSIIVSGFTIFFLVCLTNLKLLLFAFDKGPLSSHHPPLNFPHFIAIACFPIKIIQQKSIKNGQKSSPNFASQFLLLIAILPIYINKENVHQNVILFLYCIYVYIILDLYLHMVRDMVKFLIGVELEPNFNKPYLSTSLQDFWGHRWNVMVSDILRSAAYNPMRSISSRLIGEKWAKYPAILATFFVSGLMHELQLYYYGREKPRWDVMCFFLLHGICVNIEIALKSNFKGKWRQGLPRMVAAPLVVVFTLVTASWLFIPGMLRNGVDVKVRNEIIGFKEYVEGYFKALYLCFQQLW